jgi:hypothetical protein
MVRLNMLPRQHGLGDPGDGENKEKNDGPLTKDFVTPFTPLSGVFGQVVESRWLHMVRMHRNGRRCSLYSNECHIPKLDVAGSIPVSRSIFSTTHDHLRTQCSV